MKAPGNRGFFFGLNFLRPVPFPLAVLCGPQHVVVLYRTKPHQITLHTILLDIFETCSLPVGRRSEPLSPDITNLRYTQYYSHYLTLHTMYLISYRTKAYVVALQSILVIPSITEWTKRPVPSPLAVLVLAFVRYENVSS